MVTIATDTQGDPQIVNFAGFGGSLNYPIQLQPGAWAGGTIDFTDATYYGASFLTPYNGTVQTITAVVANRMPLIDLPVGEILRPFICLATLPANSPQLSYTILPETITFTDPYVGTPEIIPKYSLRWGTLENINLVLSMGAGLAIVFGMMSDNVGAEQFLSASVSGSLHIE